MVHLTDPLPDHSDNVGLPMTQSPPPITTNTQRPSNNNKIRKDNDHNKPSKEQQINHELPYHAPTTSDTAIGHAQHNTAILRQSPNGQNYNQGVNMPSPEQLSRPESRSGNQQYGYDQTSGRSKRPGSTTHETNMRDHQRRKSPNTPLDRRKDARRNLDHNRKSYSRDPRHRKEPVGEEKRGDPRRHYSDDPRNSDDRRRQYVNNRRPLDHHRSPNRRHLDHNRSPDRRHLDHNRSPDRRHLDNNRSRDNTNKEGSHIPKSLSRNSSDAKYRRSRNSIDLDESKIKSNEGIENESEISKTDLNSTNEYWKTITEDSRTVDKPPMSDRHRRTRPSSVTSHLSMTSHASSRLPMPRHRGKSPTNG